MIQLKQYLGSVVKKEITHPPIQCEDFITDISFHPNSNIIASASITGDVLLYKYTNEENTLVNTLELHTKACRNIEFSNDGRILFSTSKDKAIMLSDVESGKLIRFYEDSHNVSVYSLAIINENIFSTGTILKTVSSLLLLNWNSRQLNPSGAALRRFLENTADVVAIGPIEPTFDGQGRFTLDMHPARPRKVLVK
ncbi:hypothetical protein NQ315_005080 [Exocentrus adspersus]|uniref:WD repeat-containing protein 55 homolog n=1 Tax=Exocentrus adspersus TaxID=1586481 RepID=A0AAV8V7H2_9CUCU|nr:hypothetical protein NQ315_005080 [Exocentrus adspersus]